MAHSGRDEIGTMRQRSAERLLAHHYGLCAEKKRTHSGGRREPVQSRNPRAGKIIAQARDAELSIAIGIRVGTRRPERAMKSKLVADTQGDKTFILVLEPHEEAFEAISQFAEERRLNAASLTALGAFSKATVGWFDVSARTYREIQVDQQCEVLSALGDIALDDQDKPSLHMHVVLGLSDGSTRGGHLLKGFVRPTLEVSVVETPAHLRRKRRPELGLALIDLTGE